LTKAQLLVLVTKVACKATNTVTKNSLKTLYLPNHGMNFEGVEELGIQKDFRFVLFVFLGVFFKTLMRCALYGSHEILKVTFHIGLAIIS